MRKWSEGQRYEIVCADCLDYMRTLPDGSVDAVITDPPYGISFQSNSAAVPRYGVLANDTESFDLAVYWKEIYRVIKEGGAAYVFARYDVAQMWWPVVDPCDQIIVPRGRVSMGDLSSYSTEYEVILFNRKGKHTIDATPLKILNNSHAKNPPPYKRRVGNLWMDVIANEAWEKADHPTQKTVQVIRKALLVSTCQGSTVLDPFMGSGTTGVACMQTGRNFIGCEIDPGYFAIAKKRIEDAAAQPPLIPHESEPKHEQEALWP